jgi:hypothetical protein
MQDTKFTGISQRYERHLPGSEAAVLAMGSRTSGSPLTADTSPRCREPPGCADACTAAKQSYSITSSARSKNDSGIVRLIAFAALRLMTSSNLVGMTTGRSVGFSPLRMRPT